MQKIVLFMFIFVMATSCDKDNEPEWLTSKAKITYTGLIAVDGCGWMIILPTNEVCKPEDLPEEFMIDDLEVDITYKILEETFRCGFTPPGTPPHPMIRIDRIEKI